ncbi:MAG: tetratricopeptide repeat-containing glycosyltransferase family 2 protein [Clostridium sp.]
MASTLSACIIAKNEEKHIGTCLESLQGVADEIIVVDTGSTDRTVEIAESYGAKVYFDPWDNDFAKARNFAISKATKDYILYIDCDEYLHSDDWKKIGKLLNKRYEGFCLLLCNYIDGQETLTAQSFRIFKNRPFYEFRGRIHEQVINSILDRYKPSDIGFINVKIRHTGYDEAKNNIEKKKERNFKIYESYREDEKDAFYYYNLAGEYSRAGMLDKALETYIKSEHAEGFDNGFRQYLAIYLTKSYFEHQMLRSAIEYASEKLKGYPDFADLHFLRCTCNYYVGKYSEALKDVREYEKHKGNLNYPNFRLNEANNVDDVIRDLESNAISFDKKFFNIIIDCRNFSVCKNIQKLNEFSDNIVILADDTMSESDITKFHELYGRVVKPSNDMNYIEEIVGESSYSLYFKGNEIIDRAWLIKIIDEINNGHYDYFTSMALTEDFDVYKTVRVLKCGLLKVIGLSVFNEDGIADYTSSKEQIMITNI